MRETRVQSLGQEDPLEKEMAIHFSTLSWKIPWTEEPGRLQSMGSQRVVHDWTTSLSLCPVHMWKLHWTLIVFFLKQILLICLLLDVLLLRVIRSKFNRVASKVSLFLLSQACFWEFGVLPVPVPSLSPLRDNYLPICNRKTKFCPYHKPIPEQVGKPRSQWPWESAQCLTPLWVSMVNFICRLCWVTALR